MKLYKKICDCRQNMKELICKFLGHKRIPPKEGDPNVHIRVCERCGLKEEGFLFTTKNKELTVVWKVINK